MNKNILVTGGAGFIGSHVVLNLLQRNYEVVVVDNLSNSSKEAILRVESITNKSINFVKGDIRNEMLLKKIFDENNIYGVIHFAGLKAVAESVVKPLEYYDNNFIGTISLLKAMSASNVNNLIFSSSATVYGKELEPPYVETDILGNSSNPYGRIKKNIEDLLMDYTNQNKLFKCICLRYFNPIGAHSSGLIGEDTPDIPNNLMPYITMVAVKRLDKLSVFGNNYDTPDGTCRRDYIHVEDLSEGHIKALEHLDKVNSIDFFNLGTGKPTSVLEIIDAFQKINKIAIPYQIEKERDGDLSQFWSDPSKAHKILKWKAEKNIYDMVADSWRWQKNNPRGYNK